MHTILHPTAPLVNSVIALNGEPCPVDQLLRLTDDEIASIDHAEDCSAHQARISARNRRREMIGRLASLIDAGPDELVELLAGIATRAKGGA